MKAGLIRWEGHGNIPITERTWDYTERWLRDVYRLAAKLPLRRFAGHRPTWPEVRRLALDVGLLRQVPP